MKNEPDKNTLTVSIKCVVYNHEPYLKQCLDGFVMQKTNFRFEAIVHDDASTDKSADIIREYAELYPDIIIPVLEEENLYSKDKVLLRRKMNNLCKGKYVALCEGDDFWTDPYKLQKQVDYMEAHPGCSLCFTAADVIYEKGVPKNDQYVFAQQETRDLYDLPDLWIVATASILHVNKMDNYPYDPRFLYGDFPLIMFMLQKGYLHCIGEKMVTYRRNASSVISQTKNIQKLIAHYEAIKDVFGKKYPYADKTIVGLKLKAFRYGKFGKDSWKSLFSILKTPQQTFLMLRMLPSIVFRSRKDDDNRGRYALK